MSLVLRKVTLLTHFRVNIQYIKANVVIFKGRSKYMCVGVGVCVCVWGGGRGRFNAHIL